MNAPEFSRPVRVDAVSLEGQTIDIAAEPPEREKLARRFGLVEIGRLEARMRLVRRDDEIRVDGVIEADVVQSCVASNEPVPERVSEDFQLLFRPTPPPGRPEEEVELSEGELDLLFYDGDAIDLGEAVAETLSLSLDPYPRSPAAAEALKAAGVKSKEEAAPEGALAAALREKLKK